MPEQEEFEGVLADETDALRRLYNVASADSWTEETKWRISSLAMFANRLVEIHKPLEDSRMGKLLISLSEKEDVEDDLYAQLLTARRIHTGLTDLTRACMAWSTHGGTSRKEIRGVCKEVADTLSDLEEQTL